MKSINEIEHLLQRYKYPYRSWLPGEIDDLYEVYNNLTGREEKNGSCASCVETIYEYLYKYYMDNKK